MQTLSFSFFIVQTLILVLVLQCSTRLATCNFSENELIAKFARVSTSLKLPGIQYMCAYPAGFVLIQSKRPPRFGTDVVQARGRISYSTTLINRCSKNNCTYHASLQG